MCNISLTGGTENNMGLLPFEQTVYQGDLFPHLEEFARGLHLQVPCGFPLQGRGCHIVGRLITLQLVHQRVQTIDEGWLEVVHQRKLAEQLY